MVLCYFPDSVCSVQGSQRCNPCRRRGQNLQPSDVNTGHYDASVGVYLRGDGKGHFFVSKSAECGFLADDDAKGLVEVFLGKTDRLLLVGNNDGATSAFVVAQQFRYLQVA